MKSSGEASSMFTLQAVLQLRNRAQDFIPLGLDLEVDINCALPLLEQRQHSAARSKLTSSRISALYLECGDGCSFHLEIVAPLACARSRRPTTRGRRAIRRWCDSTSSIC